MQASVVELGKQFRVRGAPGGHTFCVGLSSMSACSLEIHWIEHYLKKLGKLLICYFSYETLENLGSSTQGVQAFFVGSC